MVCALSSASFSKTAAALMSSLGEATERVTSMLCSLGVATGTTAEWGRRRNAAAPSTAEGAGRPAAAQRQPPRSRRAARRLYSRCSTESKNGQLKGNNCKKIGSVARGPSAPPPGRRDASNEKDKKGSGVQNEVRAFLAACSWAERRAGTAPAALSHPPPPHILRQSAACGSRHRSTPSLSCCSLHQLAAAAERLRGAPLSLHVNLNTGNNARRVEPGDGLVRPH